MSALDDVIGNFPFDASDNVSRENHDRFLEEARAELELLREAAFDLAHAHITDYPDDRDALGCPCAGPHENGCLFRRILRTDPERARKMGLGWAL